MKSKYLFVLFIVLLFFDCASFRNTKNTKPRPTCSEIESQAEDCKFVFKAIISGLRPKDNKGYFYRNDKLISLLDCTPCLKGLSQEVIKDIFGKSIRGCSRKECPVVFLEYGFFIKGRSLYNVQFIFKDESLNAIGIIPGDIITVH